MKESSVAGRYARALMLITEKRSETVRSLADLKAVLATLGPETRSGSMLASPLVRLADKRKVLAEVLKPHALPTVVVFVDLLLRKKRLNELPGITQSFEALVEKLQGIRRAQVVSAVPLTPEEIQRLHRELERLTGGKINLATEVDASLVGGAMVRIGDRVIDRSVTTLLQAMEQRLLETSV
ncbi:MAG: ATP synthase F1 subunit delta [Candidatus Eisenbacteria bacterium]|uniref:ATP synthase subunit delta n=1 Tax=Eiseniibacteriota bacterium TaxID=2212470 RepID=A0A849SVL5_UNCEI|nr:ATP synthase F1 subunit delta [Candidatus Eisenbacteria bacterium]